MVWVTKWNEYSHKLNETQWQHMSHVFNELFEFSKPMTADTLKLFVFHGLTDKSSLIHLFFGPDLVYSTKLYEPFVQRVKTGHFTYSVDQIRQTLEWYSTQLVQLVMLFDLEYKTKNSRVLANALFETHLQNQHFSSSVSSPPERSESGDSRQSRSESGGSKRSESGDSGRSESGDSKWSESGDSRRTEEEILEYEKMIHQLPEADRVNTVVSHMGQKIMQHDWQHAGIIAWVFINHVPLKSLIDAMFDDYYLTQLIDWALTFHANMMLQHKTAKHKKHNIQSHSFFVGRGFAPVAHMWGVMKHRYPEMLVNMQYHNFKDLFCPQNYDSKDQGQQVIYVSLLFKILQVKTLKLNPFSKRRYFEFQDVRDIVQNTFNHLKELPRIAHHTPERDSGAVTFHQPPDDSQAGSPAPSHAGEDPAASHKKKGRNKSKDLPVDAVKQDPPPPTQSTKREKLSADHLKKLVKLRKTVGDQVKLFGRLLTRVTIYARYCEACGIDAYTTKPLQNAENFAQQKNRGQINKDLKDLFPKKDEPKTHESSGVQHPNKDPIHELYKQQLIDTGLENATLTNWLAKHYLQAQHDYASDAIKYLLEKPEIMLTKCNMDGIKVLKNDGDQLVLSTKSLDCTFPKSANYLTNADERNECFHASAIHIHENVATVGEDEGLYSHYISVTLPRFWTQDYVEYWQNINGRTQMKYFVDVLKEYYKDRFKQLTRHQVIDLSLYRFEIPAWIVSKWMKVSFKHDGKFDHKTDSHAMPNACYDFLCFDYAAHQFILWFYKIDIELRKSRKAGGAASAKSERLMRSSKISVFIL